MLKRLLKKSVKLYDAWYYLGILNHHCPTLDMVKVDEIMTRMYKQFLTTTSGQSYNPFYVRLKQMGFGRVKMGFVIKASFKDQNGDIHEIVLNDVSFSSKIKNWYRKMFQNKSIGINVSGIYVDGDKIIGKSGVFLKPEFLMEDV